MAQRRMFSKTIIESARFLKMPIESQVLYFHLGLRADDDGVVEAYPVLKILGTAEDALRVLVAKQFIKILNEDLVAYIIDWNEHNTIRADRKVDSIYKNLLIQMLPDVKPKEPKPRADTGKTTGRTMDNQRTAQVRLGKGSIGEESIDKDKVSRSDIFKPPTPDEVQEYLDSQKCKFFDGEQFCDFYTARGWLIGKNKMKDWRAAVRTWIRRDKEKLKAELRCFDD